MGNQFSSLNTFREYLSRDAEGSSLPEMKAVLAGVHLSKFLSINALLGKFIGVTIAIIGGVCVGRYGSFVHMCSVISFQLAYRVPYFKDIGNNYSVRLQMYSCAIAVGSCCSAGAPFGGVLFALELTSTFFMVGTIWKALLCTCSAMIFYQILHKNIPSVKPPNYTMFEEYKIDHELIFVVILGYLSA